MDAESLDKLRKYYFVYGMRFELIKGKIKIKYSIEV